MLPQTNVDLRCALETLEHASITVRGLARSLADSTRLAEADSPVRDQEVRSRLAAVLEELAEAVGVFGLLAGSYGPNAHRQLVLELHRRLDEAGDKQDWLSELLGADPAVRPVGWPLRGELVSHLDRRRAELQGGSPAEPAPEDADEPIRPWRSVLRPSRYRAGGPGNQRGN